MPDLGDTLPFRADLYDKPPGDGGTLVNATTATLTIILPDLTTLTPAPTITNPPAVTGKYLYDYVTAPTPGGAGSGRYQGRWLFTMATGKTSSYPEEFTVREPDPGYLLSLGSVKEHLNIPQTTTTYDEELRDWSEGATRLVEHRCGSIVQRTYTERHNDGPSLWLRRPPVVSVTSVGPWLGSGVTFATADLKVDPDSGRLQRLDGAAFVGGPWAVVYVAGRVVVPQNLQLAGKIIIKHLWETQRGAGGLPLQSMDQVTMLPGFAFAVPNRALELMAPDVLAANLA